MALDRDLTPDEQQLVRKARREYMRQYRQDHREQSKRNQDAFWLRKARAAERQEKPDEETCTEL